MMDMWISFGDGFLLLFAINDIESFEALKGKYNRIMKQKHNEKVPVVLVGNKIDLENERRVLYQKAKELANSWGAEYFEISVKTNYNIREPILKLAQEIIKIKYPEKKKNCKICEIF